MAKNAKIWGLACFFFAVFLLVYANHFDNGFYFDDSHTIVENHYIREIRNIPLFFTDPTTFSVLPANQSYRPIVTTLNALDYWLSGALNPLYFHASIFFTYFLQLLFQFALFHWLFKSILQHQWNSYLALFATALYGLHPANAETINYIIARSDSFSTFMVVLTMAIFLRAQQRKKYWSFIPFALGLLAKPTTLMVVPIVFIYILLYENDTSPFHPHRWRLFGANRIKNIEFLLALALFGILVYGFTAFMTPKTWTPGGASTWHYLISQPYVIGSYFLTFFLPLHLSADTDWTSLETVLDGRFIVGVLFILALLAGSYLASLKRRHYPIAFGFLWFLFALAPTSSLIPLAEIKNDHRIFYPFIGLTMSISWGIGLLLVRGEEKIRANNFLAAALPACAAGLILAYGYGTYQRNIVWDLDASLWYDVTRKSPKNGRGLMNYGNTQMQKGNYDMARHYFNRALTLVPQYSYLHINMAILENATGHAERSEPYFKTALELDAYNPAASY